MHILTRPTVIVDERYERNALLFCVGFVLRRARDPRPFRPLLYKWADALRSMEVERQFLTDPIQHPKLQLILDRLLVSLNSSRCECNLLLDSANALNLRAFRPPKPPALPVPDHAVPILVRGPYGGATPDYQGKGKTSKYLLYDSSAGVDGYIGGALYYPNAIEALFACMELNAIGAKSVATLVAKRLGLILPEATPDQSDEL